MVRATVLVFDPVLGAAHAETLRRLGWRSLEGRNAERIAEVLVENVSALMAGLHETEGSGR